MPSTGTTRTKPKSRSCRRKRDERAGRPLSRCEYQPRERDSWHVPPDQTWMLGLGDDDNEDDHNSPPETPTVTYSDDRRTVPLRLVGSADNPLTGATRREFRAGCRSLRAVLLGLRDDFPHDPECGKRKPRSAAAKRAEHINSRLARKVYNITCMSLHERQTFCDAVVRPARRGRSETADNSRERRSGSIEGTFSELPRSPSPCDRHESASWR